MPWSWTERRTDASKLAVNTAPNSAAPDDALVRRVQAQGSQVLTSPRSIVAMADSGTGGDVLKVVWWVYDDKATKWYAISSATTVPLNGAGIATVTISGDFVGGKIFAQVTENNGTIKELVWTFGP